jgi:catechol 2,3-dioxygenase-like lactoylglutathione lyase family enzyme
LARAPSRTRNLVSSIRIPPPNHARYVADEAPAWGPFVNIKIADGVLLQFATPPIDFPPQHYAYLLDDNHFDRAYAQIVANGCEHWADPQRLRAGEINHEHGGRGVYLLDPSGHYLELITRPYL